MSKNTPSWENEFTTLFNQAIEKYRQGHQKAPGLVDITGKIFLQSIGYTEQEFFDFIEDFAGKGEPTLETALAIAAVRRDYFLQEQKGKTSSHVIDMDKLPSKDAEVDGIGWLPRLIPKAEAKLRGEMPPELMFGCGGDRKFFRAHQIAPAEFLRQVWKAHGDHSQVISWVKASSRA
ncbi:MAG TPA: DUF5069 domain-containing protein [Candidatus Methylacidiphilales bacterium]|nr:DUF5069 domain-containing protein [Candidatus Methylacidiphilales bacterium]